MDLEVLMEISYGLIWYPAIPVPHTPKLVFADRRASTRRHGMTFALLSREQIDMGTNEKLRKDDVYGNCMYRKHLFLAEQLQIE